VLVNLEIEGFRSIRSAKVDLGQLNVLVGANGAGKSNLIAFFSLVGDLIRGKLQEFIARSGRAKANLHYGPKITNCIRFRLRFFEPRASKVWRGEEEVESDLDICYQAVLGDAAPDSLMFISESVDSPDEGPWEVDRSGQFESHFAARNGAGTVYDVLSGFKVYHFHDTSQTAGIRQSCYLHDGAQLQPYGQNLAAFLHNLQTNKSDCYQRILDTIRLIAPFFDDFELEPLGPHKTELLLNWKERGSTELFGPHQLSDGTLRAMCLVALLLQPAERMPKMIIVDEPELGLHPYAVQVVASLFHKASHHTQILATTQSAAFLDHFEPEQVIVADREQSGTVFRRLENSDLESWLEDYSLGEIWRKNVIGGGPH
jgi:predicted ATPase